MARGHHLSRHRRPGPALSAAGARWPAILELFGDCPFGHHLSSTPPSGSTFPIGTTTVTVTAWDDCGLTNTCTFTITVIQLYINPAVDWFFHANALPPPGAM